MSSSTYPLVLTELRTMRCVVVGGGAVAARKVAGLRDAGATPTVISPQLGATLAALHDAGQIAWIARRYMAGDLAGATLVFAATDDVALNARLVAEAHELGVLANDASSGERGTFQTMATVRRGDLLLAVATGGQSPGFAAAIRSEIAALFGPEVADVTERAARLRRLPDAYAREVLTRWLASSQVRAALRAGRTAHIDALIAAVVGAQISEAKAAHEPPVHAASVRF